MDNVTIGVLLDIDVVFIDIDIGVLPGLWARSPVRGVQEATRHRCFFLSLSPSLLLSLKINK